MNAALIFYPAFHGAQNRSFNRIYFLPVALVVVVVKSLTTI